MIENTRISKWLYATLSADATLMALINGIYEGEAPQDSNFSKPLIIYSYLGGSYLTGNGGHKVLLNTKYKIVVVAQSDSVVNLQPIADQVDSDLQANEGIQNDARIMSCIAEQPIVLKDTPDNLGVTYVQLGSIYNIQAQPYP